MKEYRNLMLDEERALYGIKNAEVIQCTFAGPTDGESALKETENISVVMSDFRLRYPFWHVNKAEIINCNMTEECRAAFWYDNEITLSNVQINGIKAIRECNDVVMENCEVKSSEFGWYSKEIQIKKTEMVSEYPFLNSKKIKLINVKMTGKYSFQYTDEVEIHNSFLDTKDAFWHSNNVTVYDSVIKGEYLGWYSQNLKLIRCKIIGTQPLCYAKGLILDDCEMIDCDLAFEKSEVNAVVTGHIDSVMNPAKGYILADSIGERFLTDSACEVECRNPKLAI